MAKQRKTPPAHQTTPPPAPGPVVKEKAIPKMLTVQEAADAVNVSYATLMREIGAGKLPSVKIGARRRIAQHDLWVYLQQQRTIAKPKEEGAEDEPARPLTAADRTLPLPHTSHEHAAQ
jgi:excisionase family DNA binding protein